MTVVESDAPLTSADWLRDLLVPMLRYRIDRLGLEESGAYNFYRARLQGGGIFSDYELALAAKLQSCELEINRVDEIGSGFGQLVFLLAWSGFKAVGYESDQRRGRTARDLYAILRLIDPAAAGRAQLLEAEFPSDLAPPPDVHSLVLTTNLVATRSREQQLAVLQAMRRYPYVLADMQRFFDLRRDLADEPAALALFAEAGLTEAELFLDLGVSGRYFLFVNR